MLRLVVFVPVAALIIAGALVVSLTNISYAFRTIRTARHWVTNCWLWTTGEITSAELIS